MRNFQGYFSRTFQDLKLQFPGLSRTKVVFQDFPGPGIFKKKSRTFQEFPGGVGTLCTLLSHENVYTIQLSLYTVSQKKLCKLIFLSELSQISTDH